MRDQAEWVRLFLRDVGTLTHINTRHREERGIDTRSLFCALWLRISWVANTYGEPGEEATGEPYENGKLRGCLGIPWINGWWVLPYTLLNLTLNTWQTLNDRPSILLAVRFASSS